MLYLPVVSLHVATSPELHQNAKNGDVVASQILHLSFPVLGKLSSYSEHLDDRKFIVVSLSKACYFLHIFVIS